MIKHFINFVGSSYALLNKFLTFFFKTTTWISVNWNTRFVHNEVFRLFCINGFSKLSCQINTLTWTFDLENAFSSIFRKLFMLFEDSNFWTLDLVDTFLNIFFEFLALNDGANFWTFDLIDAFSSISFESLAFDANSNFWTFVISNTSLNIFEEFRMLFDNASLFCNDDNNLMFNVDVFS